MSSFDEHEFELSGGGIEFRIAGVADQDVVRRTVSLAAHWRDDTVPHELSPEINKYFENWGRPHDVGILAFAGIEFVGGAYVRQFSQTNGAYGYVSDAIPELTIGVEAGFRRRGIAVVLLAALKSKVIDAGMPGISLSVEPDNGARHLYAKMGFELVEDRGQDLLMLWRR